MALFAVRPLYSKSFGVPMFIEIILAIEFVICAYTTHGANINVDSILT